MAVLVLPACGMQKKAAEKALADVEAAYSRIAEQARNVAPEQAQAIEAGIAAAKESLAKGDTQTVAAAAKDLSDKIKTLAEQLPALQAKLQENWNELAKTVPGALAALKKKLDDFGRPPAGMPGRAEFDSTTAQLVPLGRQWDEARSLFAGGKMAEAVLLGEQVKATAVKLITGMQTGS
jgi:hypothetical protein